MSLPGVCGFVLGMGFKTGSGDSDLGMTSSALPSLQLTTSSNKKGKIINLNKFFFILEAGIKFNKVSFLFSRQIKPFPF
jgi:hypothetical protein